MFSTVDHDQHRARRASLNRFFSTASIRNLQLVLDERVEKLMGRIREFKDVKDQVMRANIAFAALTNGELTSLLVSTRWFFTHLKG